MDRHAASKGSFRFLARVWRLVDHWNETIGGEGIDSPDACESLNAAERALRRKTHDTIRRVTADIEQRQQLNTAVSAMMELVNELYAFSEQTVTGGPGRRADEDVEHVGEAERTETICVVREAIEALVRMLAPFAPHTAEELWEMLGHEDGPRPRRRWPAFDAEVAKADEIVVPVQVNGKVRGRLTVPADTSEAELERLALADPAVQAHIAGQDGEEGRRGEGTAGVDCGRSRMRDRSLRCSCCRAATSSGCGYALAGRGSFLPAYIRIVGIPQLENRSTFFQVEQVLTEKIRTEFIGRGKYAVIARGDRRRRGADRRDHQHLRAAGRLHRAAAGVALSLHADDAGAVHRRAHQRGAVVERRADLPRGVRAGTRAATPRIDGAAFLDQERSSFDRIATDVARTVVTAILEAF